MHINLWALGLLLLVSSVLFIWRLLLGGTKRKTFAIFSLAPFLSSPFSGRSRWVFLSPMFHYLGLLFLAIAFLDPHTFSSLPEEREPFPHEGIALYLVLDQSGSMGEKVVTEEEGIATKLDLLRKATRDFVEGRPNDLIGLVTFARSAYVRTPLTLDRRHLQEELDTLQTIQRLEEDGTALGYAIYKTASVLAAAKQAAEQEENAAYTIRGAAMIVVTDGLQNPNPLDRDNRLRSIGLEEAAQVAVDHGIRLYIVSIDPRLRMESFSPERRLLERIATSTGGKFFAIGEGETSKKIYREIDQLEKGIVALPYKQKKVSYAIYFLWASLLSLLLSFLLQTTLLRTYPSN